MSRENRGGGRSGAQETEGKSGQRKTRETEDLQVKRGIIDHAQGNAKAKRKKVARRTFGGSKTKGG